MSLRSYRTDRDDREDATLGQLEAALIRIREYEVEVAKLKKELRERSQAADLYVNGVKCRCFDGIVDPDSRED